MIKKDEIQVNIDIDGPNGPGIYTQNLLKFIGSKIGKINKILSTDILNNSEDIKNLKAEVESINEVLQTIESNHKNDIDKIEKEIKDFQALLGTYQDFEKNID